MVNFDGVNESQDSLFTSMGDLDISMQYDDALSYPKLIDMHKRSW